MTSPSLITAIAEPTSVRKAAQSYAARGWPVLPLHSWDGRRCTCGRPDCASPAKHPRTSHGLHEATTDTETIQAWWERWPEAKIGLATGHGFDVLDIDGADDGSTELAQLVHDHGDVALEGPTATTGAGYHLLVQPTGASNRARFIDGCDWRGRGGYIVAPPSRHYTGRRYAWLEDGPDTPVQAAPDWLVALVIPPRPEVPSVPRPRPGMSYGTTALESECGRLAVAPEGTRNDQLNTSSYSLGQLVGAGRSMSARLPTPC